MVNQITIRSRAVITASTSGCTCLHAFTCAYLCVCSCLHACTPLFMCKATVHVRTHAAMHAYMKTFWSSWSIIVEQADITAFAYQAVWTCMCLHMHACVHAGLHACTPLLMCNKPSMHDHLLTCMHTWRVLIIMIDHGERSGYNRFKIRRWLFVMVIRSRAVITAEVHCYATARCTLHAGARCTLHTGARYGLHGTARCTLHTARWCTLHHAARCTLLHAARWTLLHAARCTLHTAARCTLHAVACCTLHAAARCCTLLHAAARCTLLHATARFRKTRPHHDQITIGYNRSFCHIPKTFIPKHITIRSRSVITARSVTFQNLRL